MNDNLHTLENGNGDWSQYRRLVVAELRRMNKQMADMQKTMSDIKTNMAVLNVKVAAIAVVASAGMSWLMNRGSP